MQQALPWWKRRKVHLPRHKPRSWRVMGFRKLWQAHTLFLLLKARARTLQLSGFVSSLGMSFKALWVMWAYTGTCDTLCLASLLVNTSSVTSQSPIEPSREPAGQGDHKCQIYSLKDSPTETKMGYFSLALCTSSSYVLVLVQVAHSKTESNMHFNSYIKRMIWLRSRI